MTERGRVTLLDGDDGGIDEALEQAFDAFVQLTVLDGHGRLTGQGGYQFDRPRTERYDRFLEVLRRS